MMLKIQVSREKLSIQTELGYLLSKSQKKETWQ